MAAAQGLYAEGLNVSASTTAWVDVCTIAAGSFTASKKYLILAIAHIRSDTSSANETRVRLVHGGTPTLFTDANSAYEETSADQDTVVGWMEVWTQPGTAELVKLQVSSSSTSTHRVILGQIFALKLDDDLTLNTDYFYNEVTGDYTTTVTPTAQASVTFTPNGTDSYLVIAQSAVDTVGITTEYYQSIYDSVEGLDTPKIEVESEDATNEYRNYLLARVFTPSAASHTFSTRISGETAGDHIALSSRIFVIRLNKFAAFGQAYTAAEDQPVAAASWETEQTLSVTPTVNGDWFYIGYFGNDVGTLTDDLQTRLQVNPDGSGLVSDPAYGDTSPGQDAWDATDVTPFAIFNFRSLASGAARAINLDCQMVSGTTLRVQERTLAAFSMQLASTGYILQTTTGTFALSGSNAILLVARKTYTTAGGYALTGNDAKLQKGYPLKTTVGTFALGGNNAILLYKRLVKTTTGTYAIAGSEILKQGRLVKTTAGAFTLSGSNAIMARGYPLKTTVGGFTLSGSNAYLLRSYRTWVTTGTFTLSGQNAILKWAHKTFVVTGAYVWAGNDAQLVKGGGGPTSYVLQITTGSFVWSGSNAYLRYYRKTFTTVGAFTWTGNNSVILAARKTFTTAGTYTLTGNNALLREGRLIKTTTGAITFTGNNAILVFIRKILSGAGVYTWTGNNVTLTYTSIAPTYQLLVSKGIFILAGKDVIFYKFGNLPTIERTYIVPAEDRTFDVEYEDRIFEVVEEIRTIIETENRTYLVEAENRIVEVTDMEDVREFEKGPGEVLDYVENWATWLGADTIATSTWSVPAGITKASDSKTNTLATIWLVGGTLPEIYPCVNTITTAGGRTAVRTINIIMVPR